MVSRSSSISCSGSRSLKVIHLSYSDLLPGANRTAHNLHVELERNGIESMMLVAKKLGLDDAVITHKTFVGRAWAKAAFQLDILPKRLFYVLPDRVMRSLPNETSLSIAGNLLVSKVSSLAPDLVSLNWINGGLLRLESLNLLKPFPLVWRLADMWPFSGAEHYTETDIRYVSGYTRTNKSNADPQLDLSQRLWNRKKRVYANLFLSVIAPSRWIAKEARRSALLQGRRIEVIPTGLSTRLFVPRAVEHRTSRRVVLFGSATGTALPRKGFAYLLEALGILAKEWAADSLELVTFGSNSQEQPFDTLWPVRALGNIQDEKKLAEIYSSADVFVAPSIQENLANTVLESLACGTPVVAFDVGGMPDAIDHMKNGYLAKPKDSVDLARGISTILGLSEADRERFRSEARAKAVRCFDITKQAAKYIRLYEEVIEDFRKNPVSR